MAINFPNSPTLGDIHQIADRVWQWDGEKWKATGTTSSIFSGSTVVFEGATDDIHETTLTVVDPTADRTITLPNATGTVALTSDLTALTGSTNTWIPTITAANALTGTANFTYDGNTLDVKNSGTASSIKLYCETSNAHYQAIKAAPHSGSSNWTLTLPPTVPSVSGQALTATTAGVASWAAIPAADDASTIIAGQIF